MTPTPPSGATQQTPRIEIRVDGVEDFVGAVELLMEAGAQGLGSRVVEVRPPLSAGQVEALDLLSRFEDGAVTVIAAVIDVEHPADREHGEARE